MRLAFGLRQHVTGTARSLLAPCTGPATPQILQYHRYIRTGLNGVSRSFSLTRPLKQSSVSKIEEAGDSEHVIPRPEESTGIKLRPYQAHAIQACLEALSSGLRRIGVSSPTGSGKTTMFMHLIPLIAENNTLSTANAPSGDAGKAVPGARSRGKTLIVVGSVELANQSELAAKRILGEGWSIEVEQSKRTASGRADVTIATYQTLNNPDRLAKFDPWDFALIIVDEAHHAAAHSYLRLLHYFNNQVHLPSNISPMSNHHPSNVPIIGFSATFSRPDQLALSSVFEKIVFHRDISTMLEDGWLSPAKSTTVYAKLGLDSVEENSQGDYKTSSLASRVNTPEIRDLVVGTYLHKASDRRSTLIFCVDLNHVARLTDAFRQAGVDARSISSLSKAEVRKDTIRAFGQGEFPVLINCEVLTEGTDIPEIDCILLARPTKSRNLLAQMVGRGLRLSPDTGKRDCHIIDIVDSVNRAGGMLVSPTLWGLTHEEKEERDDARGEGVIQEKNDGRPGSAQNDYQVTFIDQDDPFGLAKSTRPIVDRASHNAWVACGKGKYILEAMGNGYIAIDPSPNAQAKFTITYRHAIPPELTGVRTSRSPFGRVKVVGHADDLERALQTGDKYLERTLGRDLYLQLSKYASWRKKPASEKAIKLLLKMKGAENAGSLLDDQGKERQIGMYGKNTNVGNMTAGEVSSWVCAARHGAKTLKNTEDKKMDRAAAKRLAKEEKAKALQERNLPLPSAR
ncbi:uncharacterized protein I303_102627 [Kwoniella dejecticola CBS 10117]|uniref:DEAD box family helicase n=1 Tax=Kwoniella dejecticola CBS 10117 TaxID=1296121 RepID=A0A1A6A9A0_9TREE|nr:uncharacterized protein I303_02641 [Kwoniella dejecticola CBS 10117]OBR86632.1 hypothetical protein I303_02641 [Kwoniella dejecticola CBS 10117]